ncbi:MAG: dienelactone hydrolase family protein [Rhodospirillales bacterium]|nr:dienelactone hydrolase family protein [Rhodospirillales bacterium]
MTDMFTLDGPRFGPAAGGSPRSLVILLHGFGADGNDLISLAPIWAEALPGTLFVSPHAPYPCDMAPFGRQWFSLRDREPGMMLAGVQATAPILNGFIDDELARAGLDDPQLALIGFSQGTMMSLYVAPRRAKPCAGVIGYSGALVGVEQLAGELRSRPPVLLIHGDADPMVPVQAMTAAAEGLTAAGIEVYAEERPSLAHSIDETGLVMGAKFLAERLAD